MTPKTILLVTMLLPVSTSATAQNDLTVSGTLSFQGKPFAGGLVVLAHWKDQKCARFATRNPSPRDTRRLEQCSEDLPWINTDAQGNYSYTHLAPGWYDIRFLWYVELPAGPVQNIHCLTGDWEVLAGAEKDKSGKYNAFAQGRPFELKPTESKQINFDYQSLVNRGPGCAPYPPSPAAKPGKAMIGIPGVEGVLELDPGVTPRQSQLRADGTAELQAVARADHLLVTAFLQKVAFAATAEGCRAERWPRSEHALRSRKAKLDEVRQTSREGMAKVEFMLVQFQGQDLRMRDVHAYLGARDLCAEVHLSKVAFVPEDQKLFDEVLATVRLLPDDTGQAQGQASKVNDYLRDASRLYLQHKYAAAAESYQKALDLEKQQHTLDPTMFRVMVDNLGMSYGLTGNLSKAKETFEYGIAQDPQYPLFYYNLACTYGEMGQMDESLEQLRLAYRYKANIIAGESFPDPLKDDSFRKFLSDQKFVDAVHAMQRP